MTMVLLGVYIVQTISYGRLGWESRRHVGNMSARSQKLAHLANSPLTSRHKFVPDTLFCVGDCLLSPKFL